MENWDLFKNLITGVVGIGLPCGLFLRYLFWKK